MVVNYVIKRTRGDRSRRKPADKTLHPLFFGAYPIYARRLVLFSRVRADKLHLAAVLFAVRTAVYYHVLVEYGGSAVPNILCCA